MTTRDQIAVIGTGAVGAAVADRLLAGGRRVVAWNRTPSRTHPPVDTAASLADAVASATLVLFTVTGHAAVLDCLGRPGLDLSGRTAVALCTGTAAEARLTARRVADLGGSFLHAGLQASPEAIRAGTATVLYSGSRPAFDRHRPAFAALGEPRFVGEAPDAAAVWDLALFGVWYDAQLGLLRALDTVRRAGIDVAAFADTAGTQLGHVVTGVAGTVTELIEAACPPGPATLAEHRTVIRQLVEQRAGGRLGDGGLSAVAATIDRLVADGRGGDGLTATVVDRRAPAG